jgi:nitrate/TMAO reductase-like tetraheme cytochrome c subunit
MKKSTSWVKRVLFPPVTAPLYLRILPYLILIILGVSILAGGTYAWDYTNSPVFCGTACHTMPPQNAVYLNSPHANVYCTECHIGRAFLGTQLTRKTEDIYEVYSMVFHTYTFPIQEPFPTSPGNLRKMPSTGSVFCR